MKITSPTGYNPISTLIQGSIQIEQPPLVDSTVNSNEARAKIPIVPPERQEERKWKVQVAIELSKKIATDFQQEKIKQTSYETIQEKIRNINPELSHDTELITLVSCFLIKSEKNEAGILKVLPTNTIGNGTIEINPETVDPIRARTIIEHVFIDLHEKTTILDLEELSIWDQLTKLGFYKIRLIGTKPFLRRAFYSLSKDYEERLSWLDGNNPPIRDWKKGLSKSHDQNDKTNEEKAAWLLEHEAKILRSDGSWDIDAAATLSWNEYLTLSNLNADARREDGTITFLQAGSQELVKAKKAKKVLIGFDKDQVKPWNIGQQNKWTKPINMRGKKEDLIDLVTEYIIEVKLKKEKPDLFDAEGNLKTYKGMQWGDLYNEVSYHCLRNSNLTVESALQRKYPYLFETGTRHLVDAKHHGKFATPGGKQYLRELIAERFAKAGLGRLDRSQEPAIYIFTRDDLNTWCDRIYNPTTRIKTEEIFADIESEMACYSHGKNRRNTFLDFFGWDYEHEQTPNVQRAKGREFFPTLMRGNRYTLVCNSDEITKLEAPLEQKVKVLMNTIFYPFQDGKLQLDNETLERFFNNEGSIFLNSGKRFLQAGYDNLENFSFKKLIEAKSGRDYIITPQELKRFLKAISDFAACTNIKNISDARVLGNIENILSSPLDPRYMLIKLYESKQHKTIVNKKNEYNSLRLIDELFKSAIAIGNPIISNHLQSKTYGTYASLEGNSHEAYKKANKIFNELKQSPLLKDNLKEITYYDFDQAMKEIARRDGLDLNHEIKAIALFLLLQIKNTPIQDLEHVPDIVMSELMRFIFIGKELFTPTCIARIENTEVDKILEANKLTHLKNKFQDPLKAAFPELAFLQGNAA